MIGGQVRRAIVLLLFCFSASWAVIVAHTADATEGGIVTSVESPGALPPGDVNLTPMPNWPQRVGVGPVYKPVGVTLADINGDDTLEVIAGSTDNKVYVWDWRGDLLAGWPRTLSGGVQSKVAVGDLYGDGEAFLFVTCRDGMVYGLKADGGTLQGWPQNAGGTGGMVSPTLFDLDGDDTLEVIAVQYPPGTVHVWRHDGTVYPGWPRSTDYLAVATASIGDVDADGTPEICVPSYRSLYLWDKDGNAKPGWPINLGDGASYAQPALYDLDGDGRLEIAHTCYPNRGNGRVYVFRCDGSQYPGFPVEMANTPQPYVCPVAGAFSADTSTLSIFSGGHVFGAPAYHGWFQDGSPMPGFPVLPEMAECSPVVFGLEGPDGVRMMVASNTTPGALYAYDSEGTLVDGFPVATPDAALPNSPAVADVNRDGDLEVALMTMDGSVSLWTVDGGQQPYTIIDWGCWFHDNWHTGWLHPAAPAGLAVERGHPGAMLTWRPNREPDLAGYHVFRMDRSGRFERLTARALADTWCHDSTALGDTVRHYRVTAVIRAGSESRQSPAVTFNPAGIAGARAAGPRPVTATVVRGMLVLSGTGVERETPGVLLDAAGQKVLSLRPGSNDVRRLAPGVYFLRAVVGERRLADAKVVITR